MKITEVRTHLLTSVWEDDPYIPTRPHSTAFIQILTDTGLSGLGETILGYFAPEAVCPIVDFYGPALLGQDPEKINQLCSQLSRSSLYWGRVGAGLSVLSGIEMALWDLKGKALGVPLYQLLGGLARTTVKLYCSGGPALWPLEKTVEKCQYYIEQGYHGAKFGLGFVVHESGPEARWKRMKRASTARLGEQEAEKLAAVRRALGPDVDLIIDGHQGIKANPFSVADALLVV